MKRIRGTGLKVTKEKLELEPFGLTAGIDKSRPVMLFKEKEGEAVLPVWMAPVDAGIALSQHNVQACAMSPHDLMLDALTKLGIKPESCEFTEIKGHQQYVELKFSGSKKLKTMKARADHAVSFCLQAKVQFFCTRSYLQQCRDLEADMSRSKMSISKKNLRPGSVYLN